MTYGALVMVITPEVDAWAKLMPTNETISMRGARVSLDRLLANLNVTYWNKTPAIRDVPIFDPRVNLEGYHLWQTGMRAIINS